MDKFVKRNRKNQDQQERIFKKLVTYIGDSSQTSSTTEANTKSHRSVLLKLKKKNKIK
jgi:hypothetical protein